MSGKGKSVSSTTEPGSGWTNGDIHPQMYPSTRNGRIALYQNRRWIGLHDHWTRIGEGHEHDTRHSISKKGVKHNDEDEGYAVRSLMAQLCEKFYEMGWATGTGGGCSIRIHDENGNWRVFVAPSGIQKEDMIADDIFELDMDRNVIVAPKTPGLRQSACTPLWYIVYKYRPSAACVIHTHSMPSVEATLLDPTEHSKVLKLTHLEMLKGVGNHAYDDILEIPIIDNRPTEDQLAEQMEEIIQKYPKTNAVLIRRHGIYCWGDSWEQAKTQCEAFDYLFKCAVTLTQLGIDPSAIPKEGTYRENPKKRKLDSGFHGKPAVDNQIDLLSPIPLLPGPDKKYKALLLDIEGCTTSISFVKDVLFPYTRKHMKNYCQNLPHNEYQKLQKALGIEVLDHDGTVTDNVEDMALYLMDHDIKSATLKDLQGKMWKIGYENNELKGHIYDDFVPMLNWMNEHTIPVYIYSSGSIQAQKLLFGYSIYGNLLSKLSGHFDIPTAGSKKEVSSYGMIASKINNGIKPSELCFVSDMVVEVEAAKRAGLMSVLSVRPGNAALTNEDKMQYPVVYSLLQLCGT